MTRTATRSSARSRLRAGVLLVAMTILGLGGAGCHTDQSRSTPSAADASTGALTGVSGSGAGDPVDPAFRNRAEQLCRSGLSPNRAD